MSWLVLFHFAVKHIDALKAATYNNIPPSTALNALEFGSMSGGFPGDGIVGGRNFGLGGIPYTAFVG